MLPRTVTQESSSLRKNTLTAKQVQYMKPDSARRLEVPAGPPAGLYLVVHPTGKKAWAFRYRWNGATRKLTFDESYPDMTLAAARAEAESAREDLGNGIDPAVEYAEPKGSPDSVKAVVKEFIIRKVAETKTRREVERILTTEIRPSWKHRRSIAEVSRADVLRLVDGITDRGSPAMANKTLSVVKRLFSWCLERGLVEQSPVAPVKAPNKEKSRDRVLSPDELAEVWQATEQLGYPFGPFYQILILTAQRRGEVAQMRWRDLDLEAGLWTMGAAHTKSGRMHDVPLSGPVLHILESIGRFEGDYVFTTTSGQKSVNGFSKCKARLGAVMLQARREADPDAAEMANWRIHDLRRSGATHMAQANVPPHVLAAILGHSPGRTMGISAVYIRHRYHEERRQALEEWAAHVLGLVNPTEKVKMAG